MAKLKLGEVIRLKRIEKDIAQKELALKLGWKTAQFVSNIERNAANPPIKLVPKLCKILGLSTTEVFALMCENDIQKVKDKYSPYL